MSTKRAGSDVSPVDFQTAEDDMTSSWCRAIAVDVAISELSRPGKFIVEFDDSEEGHVVRLVGDGAGYGGHCSCPGNQFHDGPCAHLCAVYQRALEDPSLVPEVDLR